MGLLKEKGMKVQLSQIKNTEPKREHGDIRELKQSIADVGIINPLTINSDSIYLLGDGASRPIFADCQNCPPKGLDKWKNRVIVKVVKKAKATEGKEDELCY